MRTITFDSLVVTGSQLVDDGENTEYLRGICELIADSVDRDGKEHYEVAMEVARAMNVPEVNVLKMYNL